jgi:hypothetical protein
LRCWVECWLLVLSWWWLHILLIHLLQWLLHLSIGSLHLELRLLHWHLRLVHLRRLEELVSL